MSTTSPFVSTGWLAERLGDPGVAIVDGSWYLPAQARSGADDFRRAHIPGAVFFDIDTIADTRSGLPHMLPTPAAFAAAAGALGLSDGMTIVVYDGAGLFSAPRVWWTLRAFGARDVRVLDGGLPAWLAEGRPVEVGEARARPALFVARDPQGVADIEQVAAILANGSAAVVDARSAARFSGEAPEPRPGLRSGHMPGAKNLPFDRLVKDGRMVGPAAVTEAFAQAGVDVARPVVTTCGSGVSAAILTLALETTGRPAAGLYDGSWAEWGGLPERPVALGRD